MATKQKLCPYTYDELLKMAVTKCRETGGMPSRRSWTHDNYIDFNALKQMLGKGDWNRAEKVIREAYQGKTTEAKKRSGPDGKGVEKMTDQELLRYQGYKAEDWLKWLHRLGGGRLLREESIQTKRPEQYDMMMEVFGDWTNVRRMFVREYGQEQPQAVVTGSKKEPPKAVMESPKDEQPENKVQEPAPTLQNSVHTSDELLTLAVQECVKEGKMLSDPAWMTSKTLDFEEIVMVLGDGSWDAAKRKIEYAWTKEDERMTKLTKGVEMPKKPRKVRVNMSDAEMRRFVLEAMKVLGEKPSKAAYDVYANEHGGVSAVVLAHHDLGVSRWPKIAAEERARLLAETPSTLEQPEVKLSEEVVSSEDDAKPVEKAESAEKAESPASAIRQGSSVKDLVQVLIHGIDATVTIGGLEMQVRLDFGTKK